MTIRAADLLVECLIAHHVKRVYCVPGESYLSVLDSLHDQSAVEVVTCRHEGGAGFMALGHARLTGTPGVLMVSRGPGCMNAAIAIHSAQQDACPLVVLVGQAERENLQREAFQHIHYERMFSDMAKWVVEVEHAEQLADTLCTAFYLAQSGTPGPVIISLPEDMLEDHCPHTGVFPRHSQPSTLSALDSDAIVQAISQAERPLIIAGGLLKSDAGKQALLSFAERFSLPVATSVRHADLIPNDHPLFAGHLVYGLPAALKESVTRSDLILAIGTRLGDVTSQSFHFPAAPKAAQTLIHIWPDSTVVSRYRQTDIAVAADPVASLHTLNQATAPAVPATRQDWIASLHRTTVELRDWTPVADQADGVVFGNIMAHADALLPDDAIICLDAGNFGGWVQRQLRFSPTRQLIGPSSGAMGYGVPSAVACSLAQPTRPVVCFVGDGGFMMTGTELATAAQYGATPIVIISDNACYGTIRMHQEKHFPHRPSATALHNPNFAQLAAACGAQTFTVQHSDEFAPALHAALQSKQLCVIVVRTSLNYISPNATIAALQQSGSPA